VRCETCAARQVENLWGERSEVLAEREARATLATDEIESLVLSEKERLYPPGQRFVAIEAVPVVEAQSRLGKVSEEYPNDQVLISHRRLPLALSPTIGWPKRVLIARVLTLEQARKLANELEKPFVELIYDAEAAERARDQIRDAMRRLEEDRSQR
jgi:hypothetical protein